MTKQEAAATLRTLRDWLDMNMVLTDEEAVAFAVAIPLLEAE